VITPSSANAAPSTRTVFNVTRENLTDFELDDLMERYRRGEYRLDMLSLNPRAGPLSGGTEVTVRMSDLSPFVEAYPAPKCKFGKNNKIRDASYIKCSEGVPNYY
jgi:hypothetical protein